MTIEITVPMLPESVADATVSTWHKKPGDAVKRDENLVDIETDKVVLEVPAPHDGILTEILQNTGATVKAQDVLARLDATSAVSEVANKPAAVVPEKNSAPAAKAAPNNSVELSPSARRAVAATEVDSSKVSGTGKDGRITKQDVIAHHSAPAPTAQTVNVMVTGDRPEKRVPMTRLRARIAERLLQAQHNAAMLTTFNEINMKAVIDLRNRYKDNFEKTHQVRLGFMSFFIKAAVEALKRFPAVNASIDGNEIVYHGYYDVGVAVSTERGLVVPVIRNAEDLSLAHLEGKISDFARKARDNQITIDDMAGGTFTITNGGVFGSLMATPILNPPQSGILGMHKIEERPIAENGQVVIRPMMYVALSYDHRMIDGRESVQFLKTVKELIEDPSRLLLEV